MPLPRGTTGSPWPPSPLAAPGGPLLTPRGSYNATGRVAGIPVAPCRSANFLEAVLLPFSFTWGSMPPWAPVPRAPLRAPGISWAPLALPGDPWPHIDFLGRLRLRPPRTPDVPPPSRLSLDPPTPFWGPQGGRWGSQERPPRAPPLILRSARCEVVINFQTAISERCIFWGWAFFEILVVIFWQPGISER